MNPLLQLPRVHFAFGAIAVLPEELQLLGISRPLIVSDRGLVTCGVLSRATDALPAGLDRTIFDDVPENPTVAGVEAAFRAYAEGRCNGIIAVGGGSVIDTAKAVSVLAGHSGRITDYLGHPEKLTNAVAPLIAVPTTAGTGSEASRGAGIHPDSRSRAVGLNSPHVVPKAAICDPELILTLPPRLTAGTGMDALSHCVEAYLAEPANPPIDAIALDGIERVFGFLARAVANGEDREARWNMMMAGLEGGIAIWKGLGPAHAIANACGDQGLHHGMLVTIALPACLKPFEAGLGEKARRLKVAMHIAPEDSIADAISDLNRRVGVPASLTALGYSAATLDEIASDAAGSWFNAKSPYRPSKAEFLTILQRIT
jgi:4-hydroxybutyrate dehydrogenase